MSRWDADSDLDYDAPTWRFTRPCESRGCDQTVNISSTSVFCADCLAAAEERVSVQRIKELTLRRRAS